MPAPVRCLALALAAAALIAPAAQAGPQQVSIMMDDDLLLYNDDGVAARSLATMKSLGVDTVRVTVLWRVVAESAYPTRGELKRLKGKARSEARRQRRRFNATDPGTYPERNWDRFDNLVRAAEREGIRMYFNVTGPGPIWAQRTPPKRLRRSSKVVATYKPKVREFKRFVMAVGKRFSGSYRDENADRSVLPRVSMWSLWNEPNQGGWLTPQYEKRGRFSIPQSPRLFRKLFLYGYEGLVATGHRVDNDLILLGETAPLGSRRTTTTSAMAPKRFLRELFCLGSDGRPYTGRSAAVRGCGDFDRKGPLKANGFAHHPYTKNVAPNVRSSDRDALTMANIDELGGLLDFAADRTGRVPRDLPLFMTEFGFETNPPDPHSGVPLANQAKWNTLGEYMAYKNSRILAQAQFLLADVPPIRGRKKGSKGYWFTYQSGLYTQRGQPKPAAFAYQFPFRVVPGGVNPVNGLQAFHVWGQLRFRRNGVPDSAQIQWRPKDAFSPWVNVGDPLPVNPMGYFEADLFAPAPLPGEWRALWLRPDGSVGLFTAGTDGS